jgi:hypothetical protein
MKNKSIAEWFGSTLWDKDGIIGNGLSLKESGRWAVIGVFGSDTNTFTKDDLTSGDSAWSRAFRRIEDGLKPDWRSCSCGAKAVMGKSWTAHNETCESIIRSSPFVPKNNDGRTGCYMCCYPTRLAGGGCYRVCQNRDCEWFNK